MFYLLLESRDLPSRNAPLIIWFNGGPGCSSLTAFFFEFGPFYIEYNSQNLFENPYAWNHKANILFLESPIGVGFSYDTNVANYSKADDETTANQNLRAIQDFFNHKHPEYRQNDYFIGAESYGGVYGPMVSALLANEIAKKTFPNDKFKGLLIGNGFMNVKLTTNTMVLWNAYHARTSPDEWERIKRVCRTSGARDVDEYDFTKFMTTSNNMDYFGNNKTECGRLLKILIGNVSEYEGYDFYNFYSDCYYNFSKPNAKDPVEETLRLLPIKRASALLNRYSTDGPLAYKCWGIGALDKYLKRKNVMRSLNIDDKWMKTTKEWSVCNDKMYENYTMKYQDMTPFFEQIFRNLTGKSFQILIYNGDVDIACNYLADQYFVRNLAKRNAFKKTQSHQPWYYSKNRVIGGYFMRYEGSNPLTTHISIDVVSIRGAGHFVALDRPARDVLIRNAPLIIWFNGGPGCSSLSAFFEEFGPVFVNYENDTLFENPYAWNHKANILFLESPIGVGFSYDTNVANYSKADDETTANQNLRAIQDFFINKHPEYQTNEFFISGESYAGLYVPMVSALVAKKIAARTFPNPNFKGIFIGNGFMNVKLTTNTMVLWNAYHARTSPDEWEQIKRVCRTSGARDVDEYDFTKFMITRNNMDYFGNNKTECGRLLKPLIATYTTDWQGFNFFNFYDDCYYNFTAKNVENPIKKSVDEVRRKGISALMNRFSTDGQFAYSCWSDIAVKHYLNRRDVQKALKIDEKWIERNEMWNVCNDRMYDDYKMKYQDMTPFFEQIFRNLTGKSFQILIYNGDVDIACNYLADQYFVRNLAKRNAFKKTQSHQPWYYSKNRVIGGYFMRYEGSNPLTTHISIDVITVKGSGHFVPLDRPGPALQMFNNFVQARSPNMANYSVEVSV
ncbi:unnamed protein product [Caenorhabditis bovis]|uniref:Carboxypeptidase n=1 Tax=Caenorhabditis bovis TaxID=2654633 RepID=A0A8S1EY81_9PELO|nr:unnamed protein product [Caenorhabditis bovis]